MFMDIASPGGPGGEPWVPFCHSCRGTLSPEEPVEQISFEQSDDPKLLKLNGTYHRSCAAPILSVKRAYDMMRRFG